MRGSRPSLQAFRQPSQQGFCHPKNTIDVPLGGTPSEQHYAERQSSPADACSQTQALRHRRKQHLPQADRLPPLPDDGITRTGTAVRDRYGLRTSCFHYGPQAPRSATTHASRTLPRSSHNHPQAPPHEKAVQAFTTCTAHHALSRPSTRIAKRSAPRLTAGGSRHGTPSRGGCGAARTRCPRPRPPPRSRAPRSQTAAARRPS